MALVIDNRREWKELNADKSAQDDELALKNCASKEWVLENSGGSGGTGISPTLFYTKKEINELMSERDLSKFYTKIEANALLLQKVDTATLNKNYTNNAGLKSALAEKADKSDFQTQTQNHNKDITELTTAMNSVSKQLTTQIEALADTANKVAAVIPTDASSTNKLTSKEYVDNAVKTASARAISADENGAAFASLAALKAGKWYSLGVETTPTANDYAVVKKDASHNNNDVRYNFDGKIWVFFQEFTSGGSVSFTTSQQNALDSGITSAKVTQIQTNTDNITKEASARTQGDADLAADIEKKAKAVDDKIGDLAALNTDISSSIVECINDLHTEIHDERVAKSGDTMTGELCIELAGSGAFLKFKGGDKGANFSIDANTGIVSIAPESAPTTGFELSHNAIAPRTNAIDYELGTSENTWDNGYIENLKEVKTLNGTDVTELVVSVAQVKQLIIDLEHPIGSVIHSFDYGYDPNNVYAGTTWEKIKEGIFLEATEVADTIGTEKEAGLPNITGTINSHINTYMNVTTGAIRPSDGYSYECTPKSGRIYNQYNILSFDASRSSAVYGKSDTVQPHSITCFIWRRIA